MDTKEYFEKLTEQAWLSIPRRTHAIYDRIYAYGEKCFELGTKALGYNRLKWQDVATIVSLWEDGLKNGRYTNIGDSELMEKQSRSILKQYKTLKGHIKYE